MKIGIFDSGLGGLIVMRRIVEKLPRYDFVYLGDSARLPYGTRSADTVYEFTRQGVEFLFRRGCKVVILACNTASSQALRKIQRQYLPAHYPNCRVLGVVVPTLEAVLEKEHIKRLGVLATTGTVRSHVYGKELKKLKPGLRIFQVPAPMLVSVIENGDSKWYPAFVRQYLAPLLRQKVDSIILGCTHYPILKNEIKKQANGVKIFSQEEIIPAKLKDYLDRHPEIEKVLSRNRSREILVTDITKENQKLSKRFFGKGIKIKKVVLD